MRSQGYERSYNIASITLENYLYYLIIMDLKTTMIYYIWELLPEIIWFILTYESINVSLEHVVRTVTNAVMEQIAR